MPPSTHSPSASLCLLSASAPLPAVSYPLWWCWAARFTSHFECWSFSHEGAPYSSCHSKFRPLAKTPSAHQSLSRLKSPCTAPQCTHSGVGILRSPLVAHRHSRIKARRPSQLPLSPCRRGPTQLANPQGRTSPQLSNLQLASRREPLTLHKHWGQKSWF